MASGIKGSCNRPKIAKHLRTATTKNFKNEDEGKRAAYKAKIAARQLRKAKRKAKR